MRPATITHHLESRETVVNDTIVYRVIKVGTPTVGSGRRNDSDQPPEDPDRERP